MPQGGDFHRDLHFQHLMPVLSIPFRSSSVSQQAHYERQCDANHNTRPQRQKNLVVAPLPLKVAREMSYPWEDLRASQENDTHHNQTQCD